MAEFPDLPLGTGFPIVDALSGEFKSSKIKENLNETFGAPNVLNPESDMNDAIKQVVDDRLGGGAGGLMKIVDARGNLGMLRPPWAGQIVWLINETDPNPTHIAPSGDLVFPVKVQAVAWTPSQLANKIAWYDAQTLGLTNGAAVANWPDLSGNGNHLVQATAGAQPVLVNGKIDGHPAVVADGVNDWLVANLTQEYAAGSFTLYVVAGTDLADNAAGGDFLIGGSGTTSANNALDLWRTPDEAYNMRRVTSILSANAVWTTGKKKIVLVFDGLTSSVVHNGVQVASGQTAVSGTTLNKVSLFARADGANFFPGYVGELLLIRGTVSSEIHTKIIDYLHRWDA